MDTPRPTGTALPPDTVAQVVATLTKAMAVDRLFLDPELTVDKLGRHIQLPPKLISAVLNQHMHKNFNGFVNTYRIDEVKARLTNPANAYLTLTGIALESGFNSQATFQRAFRQQVGLSPKEFLARQPINTAQIQI